MVVQTLSIASDILPAYLGDTHQHEHSLHTSGDPSPAQNKATSGQSDDSNLAFLLDPCHGNHCHGSHLPLAMYAVDFPVLISKQLIPGNPARNPSGHIDGILRPPIV